MEETDCVQVEKAKNVGKDTDKCKNIMFPPGYHAICCHLWSMKYVLYTDYDQVKAQNIDTYEKWEGQIIIKFKQTSKFQNESEAEGVRHVIIGEATFVWATKEGIFER